MNVEPEAAATGGGAAPEVVVGRSFPDRVDVAVVGGGLAGLICARALHRSGRRVHVFESSDRVGGRMRTEVHRDGFRLDAGYHVLVTGYPALRGEIDLDALRLRPYEPGCVIARGGRLHSLPDPYRTGAWREALRFPLATFGDKVRLARWRGRLLRSTPGDLWRAGERTSMEHLRSIGFSQRFVESFFVPFLGGIFQDRALGATSPYLECVMRALNAGPIAIPAEGIEAVPRQVAASLPPDAIHLGAKADAMRIVPEEQGGGGVLSIGGTEIAATHVVLACAPDEVARLSGLELPSYEPLGVTTAYFAAPRPPSAERRLFLRGDNRGVTNQFVVLSNIARDLAPSGEHLLSGSILGTPEGHAGDLAEPIRSDMAFWFPHAETHRWRWLATYKVPLAQWAMPPGMRDRLPRAETPLRGILLAGDWTREPSVEGAIASGLEAARHIAAPRDR